MQLKIPSDGNVIGWTCYLLKASYKQKRHVVLLMSGLHNPFAVFSVKSHFPCGKNRKLKSLGIRFGTSFLSQKGSPVFGSSWLLRCVVSYCSKSHCFLTSRILTTFQGFYGGGCFIAGKIGVFHCRLKVPGQTEGNIVLINKKNIHTVCLTHEYIWEFRWTGETGSGGLFLKYCDGNYT